MMKLDRVALSVSLALLVGLSFVDPQWHLAMGIAGWFVIRVSARELARSVGRPVRWLQSLAFLCLLGALFGKSDSLSMSVSWSKSGALAGVTMVVRAFALVSLTSLASSVLPFRRWIDTIEHPVVRRLVEVLVIAANLVPVQLRALTVASANLQERRPGLRNLRTRLWLLALHSVLRAAMLAEDVSLDMAIASHNAEHRRKALL